MILGSPTLKEIDLTGLTPTQSSTCCDGVPSRAVDGNRNAYWSAASCTATSDPPSTDPWWRVQLPGRHVITEVVLYNRSTNRGRLSPVYVYVQESSIDILCGSYTNSYMAMLNFTCPALLKGDVLWVEVRGTYKVLTICEVKVYGWEL